MCQRKNNPIIQKIGLVKLCAGKKVNYEEVKHCNSLICLNACRTVQIELTRDLYDITGEKIILNYSDRWASYKNSYFIREFIKQRPDYHDMVILGLNVLGVWIAGNIVGGLLLLCRKISRSQT